MAISIRSYTMIHRRTEVARPPQITLCPRIRGLQQQHPQIAPLQPRCSGHLVLQWRKWRWWINWGRSRKRSTNARKLPLLASIKSSMHRGTWAAWVSWRSSRWTWIERRTSRVMPSTRLKSTRLRVSMTYSCKHKKLTWTRLTPKEGKCGHRSSSNNEKTRWLLVM